MKSRDNDKDINKFPLPKIDDAFDDASAVPREIFEETSIDTNPEDVGLSSLLNEEQRATYDEIMSKVDTEQGGLFFVDDQAAQERLSCIEHFSKLFTVGTKLSLLLLHLVSQHL
jgi:hypothetical protein